VATEATTVTSEIPVPIVYDGLVIGVGCRIDLVLVEQ
jgi:putative methionine-R-sulfoxide reductase with GAF domain